MLGAIAGEMLVDGVVEHLEDAMVQPALIGVADVHARALPDRFQPLEFVDLGGIVFLVSAMPAGRSAGELKTSVSSLVWSIETRVAREAGKHRRKRAPDN